MKKAFIFFLALLFIVTVTGCGNSKITGSKESSSDSVADCVIKGNISSSGEKIYHLPDCQSYSKTVISEEAGEKWFCSENEAVKAGWRKAKNCN